ncbi:MAG: hypothetical protein ACFFDF_07350 [Candidatus Odinarchaeota archaeon]
MSSTKLELKWISFVKSLRSVGALLMFIFIPYLAFVIIPILFILAMIAIRNIKEMNHELNNSFLTNFHSKYLTASIVKFIGSIIVHVGSAMLAIFLAFGPMMNPFYPLPYPSRILPPTIILLIIGFIIMIIGSAVEVGAWDNLKLFIQDNKNMFPEKIQKDTITSVENLRTGAFLWALGFLIIPIVIGWIFQLIGYFTLSNAAKWGLEIEPITPIAQDIESIPSYPQKEQPISMVTQEDQPSEVIKFCPMCGASVQEGAKYCGECGVNLVS